MSAPDSGQNTAGASSSVPLDELAFLGHDVSAAILDHMLNGVACCRMLFEHGKPHDFVYLYTNPAFHRQTGLGPVRGKRVSEVVPGIRESDPLLFEIYGRVAAGGAPEVFETLVESLQQWFAIQVFSPRPGYFIAVFDVVTGRKQAEESLREREKRFRNLFDLNPLPMWLYDTETLAYLQVNDAAIQHYGFSREEFLSMTLRDVRPPENVAALEAFAGAGGPGAHGDLRVHRKKDGQLIDVAVWTERFELDGRECRIAVIEDVTERTHAQEALRESEARYRALAETSTDGFWALDRDGRIVEVNEKYTNRSGYSREELLTMTVYDLDAKDSVEETRASLVKADDSVNRVFETLHRAKDGSVWPVEISTIFLPVAGGRRYSFLRDISKRKAMEERVRQMAFQDALTQLPNRRLLSDRLSQALAASKRSGCYGALMFLDLDNFKQLNDAHGHKAGDLLLIEAAHRLSTCLRQTDTVARFGGDEFVVLIGELGVDRSDSTARARLVAEKLRAALARPYVLGIRHGGEAEASIEHRCTVSIGVALFFKQEATQDDLLKWADAAMYQAKEAGRNLIRFAIQTPDQTPD